MGKKFKTYQEALDAVKNLGEDLKNSDMEFILIFTDRFNGSPFLHAGLYETITMLRIFLSGLTDPYRNAVLSVLETFNDANIMQRMEYVKLYNSMVDAYFMRINKKINE